MLVSISSNPKKVNKVEETLIRSRITVQLTSGTPYSAGNPIIVDFSPVTDFREATCRQYEEDICNRGGYCNFMHLKKISRWVSCLSCSMLPQSPIVSPLWGIQDIFIDVKFPFFKTFRCPFWVVNFKRVEQKANFAHYPFEVHTMIIGGKMVWDRVVLVSHCIFFRVNWIFFILFLQIQRAEEAIIWEER